MIHVLTLTDFPEPVIDQLRSRLYLAFGIGCELAGDTSRPKGDDATSLLSRQPPVQAYTDDKVLYLTANALRVPAGPLGEPPATGFADPAAGRAIVSTHGLTPPKGELTEANEEAWLDFADRIARRAVQQMGFLWGLHRCVDSRCAMFAPWAPEAESSEADATLCDYCQKKSEVLLDRARS